MPDASEKKLIRLSQQGDTQAFSALIQRYEDRIYNLARKVCSGIPSEAEDVYQDTFLNAFKKIKSFRAQSSLGTWLFRIASNLCLMKRRRNKTVPFVPILDEPHEHDERNSYLSGAQLKESGPELEEILERKSLKEKVEEALKDLPVEYRLVIALRDMEGLSAKETADILKITIPAVKSRLHRARLFMRDRLAPLKKESALK